MTTFPLPPDKPETLGKDSGSLVRVLLNTTGVLAFTALNLAALSKLSNSGPKHSMIAWRGMFAAFAAFLHGWAVPASCATITVAFAFSVIHRFARSGSGLLMALLGCNATLILGILCSGAPEQVKTDLYQAALWPVWLLTVSAGSYIVAAWVS